MRKMIKGMKYFFLSRMLFSKDSSPKGSRFDPKELVVLSYPPACSRPLVFMQTVRLEIPTMPESINYTIEFLHDIDLLRQCVDIQRKAWGFADEDLLPLRMLVVCSKIG